MGIYYNTYLYTGHFTKDTETPNVDDSLETRCFGNGVVKFEDDYFIHLAKLDPIIEKHEVARGYVDAEEVEKLLIKYHPEYKGRFDYSKGNVYMCETSWTTYDSHIVEYVTHNIVVRKL